MENTTQGTNLQNLPKMFLRKIFILDILDAFFLRMFVNIYFVKKNNNAWQKVKEKNS